MGDPREDDNQGEQQATQIRRGRRRREEDNVVDNSSTQEGQHNFSSSGLVASLLSPASKSTSTRKPWTRSLSPRRTVAPIADNAYGANLSPFHESFNHSLVAPVMSSIKRWTTGRTTRSQSPMPQQHQQQLPATFLHNDDLLAKPPITKHSNKNSNEKLRVAPRRSKSDSLSYPKKISRKNKSHDNHPKSLQKKPVSESHKMLTLRPPSGRDLRSSSPQQQQKQNKKEKSARLLYERFHKSFDEPSNFMLLDSDDEGEEDNDEDNCKIQRSSQIDVIQRPHDKSQSHLPIEAISTMEGKTKPRVQRKTIRSDRPPKSRSAGRNDGTNEFLTDAPSSTKSLASPRPRKHVSDPTSGDKSTPRKPSSMKGLKSTTSSMFFTKHTSEASNDLAPSQQAIKKASDTGRSTPIVTSTPTTNIPTVQHLPRSSPPLGPKKDSSSSPSSTRQQQKALQDRNKNIVDKVPKTSVPTPIIIERPNLNKESLEHVKNVKDSFRRMRTQQYAQRHKVKFEHTDGSVPKSKSAPPASPAIAAAIASRVKIDDNMRKTVSAATFNVEVIQQSPHTSNAFLSQNKNSDSQQHHRQPPSSAQHVSTSRLQGITVDDLEVGYLKTPTKGPNRLQLSSMAQFQLSQSYLFNPSTPSSNNNINSNNTSINERQKIDALAKAIKKTKKFIKRTCRDVWTERDEIVFLQRTNWSIRKSLLQMDVPKDSITTLNLKLEKAVRKEREMSTELDNYKEEKQMIELECSHLTKMISEFKDLLDALNTTVVPLLPAEDNDVNTDDHGNRSNKYLVYSRTDNPTAAAAAATAVMHLLDDEEFSDSIHSMEEKNESVNSVDYASDEELERSLSLSHLRDPMPPTP